MTRVALRAPLAGAAGVLLVCGCGAPPAAENPAPVAAPAAAPAAPVATVPPPSAVAPLPPSEPIGLAVPAIGVDTGPLLALGIDDGGALEVPPEATTAGWFTLGPTPGSRGPAVVAGHVGDARTPGVFHRLADVAPGDEITVARADGTRAVFDVHRVERYAKSEFPTQRVYGDTDGPELRLITCGGAFDTRSGRYRDNVVVYARLVRVT